MKINYIDYESVLLIITRAELLKCDKISFFTINLEKLYEKYTFTILSLFHHISHTWFGYIISVLIDREIINFFPSQKNKKKSRSVPAGLFFMYSSLVWKLEMV